MNTIRAVIAEDEPLARRTLRQFTADVSWLDIAGVAENGREAVRLINKLEPDLVFLDVQMPELTGLEVLDRIDHHPAIVFTTAYDRYAVAAFELEAVDYLVKPFGRKRFRGMLERVRQRLEAPDGVPSVVERARPAIGSAPLRRFFARKGNRIVQCAVDDITRAEARENYVCMHTGDGSFLLNLTLNDLETRLDGERFRRVHRSHIVNLDFVRSMEPYDDRRLVLTMRDGSRVIASRGGSQALRELVD